MASAAPDGREPDVRIALGSVSERLEGGVDLPPLMQASADAFQMNTPAGRYRVTDGRLVTVQPVAGASARDLRLYLLGSVMGALAHQRSALALHAAVIEAGGRAIAVAGPSGAGKSTLAALHALAGGGVLTDDLCVVDTVATDGPVAHRGLGRIKLWSDSAELAGWRPPEAARISDTVNKFALPVLCVAATLPLDRIYVLRPDEAPSPAFRRLRGVEAAAAVVAQVYRWPVAVAMGKAGKIFEQCMVLASERQIFELRYTHNARSPGDLYTAVIRHAAAGVEG